MGNSLLTEAVASAYLGASKEILISASVNANCTTGQLCLQDQVIFVALLWLASSNHDRGHFLSKFLAGVNVLVVCTLTI